MRHMKKTTVLVALAALIVAATVGCASPTDQLCIENQKCEGAADPAAECAELKADCEEDEECADAQERCKTQGDAVSACILAGPSSCQDVGEASFYLPEDEDACSEELQALIDCQEA